MWYKSNEPLWSPIVKSDIPHSVTSSCVKVLYILNDRLTDFSGNKSDGFLLRSCLGVCVFLLNTCIIGGTISLPSDWESAAMSYPLVQLNANKNDASMSALAAVPEFPALGANDASDMGAHLNLPAASQITVTVSCGASKKFARATWRIQVQRPAITSLKVWMCLGLCMS